MIPMEATVDSAGRILVPKQLRDALGITPGSAHGVPTRIGVATTLIWP
ncbi:AbrB/MazE/SpoVT family DNA-binding domain-containing protein [Tsukamurella asaccharolytica]|nr:AbrB/MazE/SpoVT family DNA-binding domain-containing protein [Tsukamurella asaccharolytica]